MIKEFIKSLNKYERIYILVFIGSIFAGIGYGIIDAEYYKCCEESIGEPEEGANPLKIFKDNYFLSLFEMGTVGIASLYFNFHTFSVTSSYLNFEGRLITIPIILLIGIFELAGSLLLVLMVFSLVERLIVWIFNRRRFRNLIPAKKLTKLRTKLKARFLFVYGTALIFAGAVIEYLLLQLF